MKIKKDLPKILLPAKYSKLIPKERRWVREEYVRRQEGKCWYCKEPLNIPPPERITNIPVKPRLYPQGFFDRPIHLQHNHVTDMTEGAVHAYCNAVLWEYEGR